MANVYKVILDAQDKTAQAFSKLERNLGKAQKATDRVKKSLGGMTGAIGLAAGAAGFGALAKNALDAADELGKFADRTGIAASELASMQLASNYAGVSTETFNKILVIFQKRLGEAVNGTGTAKRTLDSFGISAEKLAELPLDKQLGIIGDEFKKMENPALRAAAASDLFSNRGIKMINFLMEGSDGLSDLRKEFRELGLEIDDTTLDQIENFNDATTKLSAIVNVAMVKALAEVSPEMTKFTERASEMAVPLIGDLFKGITFLVENMDKVTLAIKGFLAVLVVTKILQFGAAITAVFAVAGGPITLAILAVGAITAAVVLFMDEIKAMVQPVIDAGKAVGDFVKKINPFSSDVDEAAEATRGLAIAEEVLEEATGGAASKLLVLRSAGNKVQEAADKATKPINDNADAIERVVDAATPAAPAVEEFGDSTDETADEAMNAAVRTNEFADAIERLQKESRTGVDDVADLRSKMEEYQKAVDAGEASQEDLNRVLRRGIEDIGGVKIATANLLEEIQTVNEVLVLAREKYGENSEAVRLLKGRLEELTGEYLDAQDAANGLTKEHKDMLDRVKGLTPEVKKVHEEIKILNDLYVDGKISATEFREQTDRLADSLKDTGDSASDAQGALADLLGEMAAGEDGNLGKFIDKLIGRDGVKSAIEGCFGTGPINSFDNAVKSLFPTFTEFEGVIGSLTGALGDFFAGGELKFSAFKDAILKTMADIAAGAIASVGINFLKNLIPGLNTGGSLDGYAFGGRVTGPGGPKDDKVLARLSAGEYVIQASSVSKFGKGFFDQLNAGQMPVPGLRLGGMFESIIDMIRNNTLIYGGEAPFSQYLFDLYQILSQEDPRDSPDEAYEAAMEIILARIMRAIVNSNNMMEGAVGTKILGNGIMGDIFSGIAGPIGAMSQTGFLNRFSDFNADSTIDGLTQALFDALLGPVSRIQAEPINFNMDDVVAKLFNDANGVAGGSLTLDKRQFGGPLERGQAALVGESGPEVFIPGSGGTVSPIANDGANALIGAVHEVRDEISDLRRQMSRIMAGQALAGGRA